MPLDRHRKCVVEWREPPLLTCTLEISLTRVRVPEHGATTARMPGASGIAAKLGLTFEMQKSVACPAYDQGSVRLLGTNYCSRYAMEDKRMVESKLVGGKTEYVISTLEGFSGTTRRV